jgi:DNA-binding NarL/FixJ family response regulator
MAGTHKVLIVENHEHLAVALAHVFGNNPAFEVCGVAGDIPDAVTLMRADPAALVILDVNLPSGYGWELIPVLRGINPAARYLMFSNEDPLEFGRSSRDAGAHGYLRKGAPLRTILKVALIILAGGAYFPLL